MKKSAYDIRKIYEQIEFDLISSMKRNLKRHELEEEKEGFKWEQWQSAKLRALRAFREENKRVINEAWQEIKPNFKQTLQSAFGRGLSKFQKLFVSLPKNNKQEQANVPAKEQLREPEKSFFSMNSKKLEALEKTVENDLKKANRAIWRKMDDVYRQTVYNAEIHMSAGAKSLDQAIDLATKDFLKQGINCIEYKNGNRVNIASYVEMALRTASHRATLLGEGENRNKFGVYTVVVSAHANTCPLCEKWQGKVLIDDVFTSLAEDALKATELSKQQGYPLVSEAIDKGLLHPNCRHSLITYFPGVTKLPTVSDGEEAIKKYEAEQKQRALEREIRKWKRLQAGSCDPENAKKAGEKVKGYQEQLRGHLKQHPYLRRNYSREKTRDVPTISSVYISRNQDGAVTESQKASHKEKVNNVNFELVNSVEYKNKFKGITNDEATDMLLYEKAKDMLKHRNNTNYEDMHLIDTVSKKVVGTQTHSADILSVTYNKSLNRAIKNHDSGTLISIHNHPNSLPPSGSDFASIGKHEYLKGIIACHNGDIYIYETGYKLFSAYLFDKNIEKNENMGYNELKSYEIALNQFKRDYDIKWERR